LYEVQAAEGTRLHHPLVIDNISVPTGKKEIDPAISPGPRKRYGSNGNSDPGNPELKLGERTASYLLKQRLGVREINRNRCWR
jgi:hypothetical protein